MVAMAWLWNIKFATRALLKLCEFIDAKRPEMGKSGGDVCNCLSGKLLPLVIVEL